MAQSAKNDIKFINDLKFYINEIKYIDSGFGSVISF